MLIMFSGCLEAPEVNVIDQKSEIINETTTLTTTTIEINNPNPLTININNMSFNIYALINNNSKILVGHGGNENIQINEGNNIITIPIEMSNKKLIDLALETDNNKIPILIEGNISVDLIITSINIPVSFEQEIDLSPIAAKNKLIEAINNTNITKNYTTEEIKNILNNNNNNNNN